MTDEERADWEAALDNIDASFSLEAGRDLRRSLRRRLAGDGADHRRLRGAQAQIGDPFLPRRAQGAVRAPDGGA